MLHIFLGPDHAIPSYFSNMQTNSHLGSGLRNAKIRATQATEGELCDQKEVDSRKCDYAARPRSARWSRGWPRSWADSVPRSASRLLVLDHAWQIAAARVPARALGVNQKTGSPKSMERETGIEPVTSSLGSWRSTAELLPPNFVRLSSPLLQNNPPEGADTSVRAIHWLRFKLGDGTPRSPPARRCWSPFFIRLPWCWNTCRRIRSRHRRYLAAE